MPTLTIFCSQADVVLGEKVSLIATVAAATPGSTANVDISAGGSDHWPGTIHVNSAGSGGCVSSDVVLPGTVGMVTTVVLTGTATSSAAGDVYAPATTSVKVHG
jgi:hypothetical protein